MNYYIYIFGFVNSSVFSYYINAFTQTLNFEVGQIGIQPIMIDEKQKENINSLVKNNIQLSQTDWDSFETSWDFKKHPLI